MGLELLLQPADCLFRACLDDYVSLFVLDCEGELHFSEVTILTNAIKMIIG